MGPKINFSNFRKTFSSFFLLFVREYSNLECKLDTKKYKRCEIIIPEKPTRTVTQAFFWLWSTVHTELLIKYCTRLSSSLSTQYEYYTKRFRVFFPPLSLSTDIIGAYNVRLHFYWTFIFLARYEGTASWQYWKRRNQ